MSILNKNIFSIFCIICIVNPVELLAETNNQTVYTHVYALIIGINNYNDGDKLDYAVQDAIGIKSILLKNYNFTKIITLINEQATKKNILKYLIDDWHNTEKNDAILLFFAGHGGRIKSGYGDIGYIMPYGSNKNEITSLITMESLRLAFKTIKAKHIFFIIDSCYAGTIFDTRGLNKFQLSSDFDYIKEISSKISRQVLTAGTADQEVLDGGGGKMSVFAKELINLLNQNQSYLTASTIGAKIKDKVFKRAKFLGLSQTPKFATLDGDGDFIFISKNYKFKKLIEDKKNLLKELDNIEKETIEYEKIKNKIDSIDKKIDINRFKLDNKFNRKDNNSDINNKIDKRPKIIKNIENDIESIKIKIDNANNKRYTIVKSNFETLIMCMQKIDYQIREYAYNLNYSYFRSVESINGQNIPITYKGEFETSSEYEHRKEKILDNFNRKKQLKLSALTNRYIQLYDKQIKPLVRKLRILIKEKFSFGNNDLVSSIGRYNADAEEFPVKIYSNLLILSKYPHARFGYLNYKISKNNDSFPEGTPIIKIPSLLNSQKFKIKTGLNTISYTIDTYNKILDSTELNSYLNGFIKVPRNKAKNFKRKFKENKIGVKLTVQFLSPFMAVVGKIDIIDKTDNSRFSFAIDRSSYGELEVDEDSIYYYDNYSSILNLNPIDL